MIRIIGTMLLLAGCAAQPRIVIPTQLQACAEPVPVPAPLPRVRTAARVAQFAIALELAREAERRRGDDCAERLADLNRLIERVTDGR